MVGKEQEGVMLSPAYRGLGMQVNGSGGGGGTPRRDADDTARRERSISVALAQQRRPLVMLGLVNAGVNVDPAS